MTDAPTMNSPRHRGQARAVTRMLTCALGAAVVSMLGCGSDFDPGSRVTSLRILAIQADQPFARPGETVNLTALWHDPEPDRTVTLAWTTCVNPLSTTVIGCFAQLASDAQKEGRVPEVRQALSTDPTASTWSVTVPPDSIDRLPVAGQPAALMGIVLVVCPGQIVADANYQLGSAQLPVRCLESGTGRELRLDEFDSAIKRIFVRRQDRNANPVISRVTWEGADWAPEDVKVIAAACPATENRYDRCKGANKPGMSAEIDPASFETGVDEYGADFREQLVTQYYSTEGLFEYPVRVGDSPATHFAARAPGDITLWFIARDNRGGMSWTTRRVRVE